MADTLPLDLFKPSVTSSQEGERVYRPTISYLKDALLRLRRNKTAIVAFTVIVCVALTGFIGPFFFPRSADDVPYENSQNTDFRSQDPTWGKSLLITEDNPEMPDEKFKDPFNTNAPLISNDNLTPPTQFEIKGGGATVNGASLTWLPIEGVSGYKIYRFSGTESEISETLKEFQNPLTSQEDLNKGILVATLDNPAQYTYNDAAGLDGSQEYIYSIASFVKNPQTGDEVDSKKVSFLHTKITRTIRLADALALDSKVKVGEYVKGHIHPFGTDSLGRDIFARTLEGTRVAFLIAFTAPLICIVVGLIFGSLAGLAGGYVDLIMMRFVEIMDAIPELLVLILLQLVIGQSVLSLIITLSLFSWVGFARMVRGEVLRLREIEFVQASRLLGAGTRRLISRHIAPNLFGIIIVVWTTLIPRFIAAEAFLSFIGLGIESPKASWGNVLLEAGNRIQVAPLQFLLPSLVVGSSLLAFFLLGDALRDAFDPKLRGRE